MLDNILSKEDRDSIDALVETWKQKLPKDSVALWIANRPDPNEREAEAISNPYMFEVIQERLKENNIEVFYIADGFSSQIKLPDGRMWYGSKEVPEDKRLLEFSRYPWTDKNTMDVGRFWEKETEVKAAGRLGQWYFVYKLMDALCVKSIVGIRSGALEPFALLGINVIYLEHESMFTPDRHACWQGRIPYHRLITQRTTGYLKKQTEDTLYRKKIAFLSNKLKVRVLKQRQPYTYRKEEEFSKLKSECKDLQIEIASITEEIAKGVILKTEGDVLLKMVEKKCTAKKACENLKLS